MALNWGDKTQAGSRKHGIEPMLPIPDCLLARNRENESAGAPSPSLSLTFADVGWFTLSLNSATRTLYASAVDRLTNEPRGTRIAGPDVSAFVALLPRGTQKSGNMLFLLQVSGPQP